MTTGTSTAAQFEPVHKAHAIEQVAIGLTFDKEVDDESLRRIGETIGSPPELPGRSEIRGLSISFGLDAPSAPTTGKLSGFDYRRVRADGATEAEFQVLRSVLVFRTMLYTRWDDVWAQAMRCFAPILPMYFAQARLSQASLNYVDKFVCYARLEECHPRSILNEKSPYLCPHVFSAPDLWHSHTGFFQRIDEQVKRLVTVNVDYLTESFGDKNRVGLSIKTALVDLFNQPEFKSFSPSADEAIPRIDAYFQQLHEQAKGLLKGIISGQMAKRIALES